MDSIIVEPFIKFLQNLPTESTSLILFVFCLISILTLFYCFGKNGLYIYSIIAVVAANIQVLKLVKFSWYPAPVALGTIVFASTYLCSGILTEHYGSKVAQANIWFCFTAQILMTLFMLLTIGHKPLIHNILTPNNMHALQAEQAIALVFTPLPRLLIASLVAFVIAQQFGIWTFSIAKLITHKKYLWLRTIILIIVSMLIDTLVFNLLAWKVLTSNPMSVKSIFKTYMLATLITQGLITMFSTPIIYLSYKFRTE